MVSFLLSRFHEIWRHDPHSEHGYVAREVGVCYARRTEHAVTPMIKFHFDAGKNSIFYEFELSKILKHPVVF